MTPEMQVLVAEILTSLIKLLVLVIGGLVVNYVKANVSRKQLDLAMTVADLAVQAVEQLADAGKIEYKKKFETAIALGRDQAAKWGLTFTDEQWKGFIEAAVKAMKDTGKELRQPDVG